RRHRAKAHEERKAAGTEPNMSRHEQFEVMCALAVTGQINDRERSELEQHLETCSDCRERISDFAQISAQALPLCGETQDCSQPPRELTLRFVIRARAEGVPLAEVRPVRGLGGLPLWRRRWQAGFAAAALMLLIVVGVVKYLPRRPHSSATAS